MANPKEAEKKQHGERREKFMAAFANAAGVLEQFKSSKLLAAYPKNNDYGTELLEQFFMAHALSKADSKERTAKSRIVHKMETHLGVAAMRVFTPAYLSGVCDNFTGKLTAAQSKPPAPTAGP